MKLIERILLTRFNCAKLIQLCFKAHCYRIKIINIIKKEKHMIKLTYPYKANQVKLAIIAEINTRESKIKKYTFHFCDVQNIFVLYLNPKYMEEGIFKAYFEVDGLRMCDGRYPHFESEDDCYYHIININSKANQEKYGKYENDNYEKHSCKNEIEFIETDIFKKNEPQNEKADIDIVTQKEVDSEISPIDISKQIRRIKNIKEATNSNLLQINEIPVIFETLPNVVPIYKLSNSKISKISNLSDVNNNNNHKNNNYNNFTNNFNNVEIFSFESDSSKSESNKPNQPEIKIINKPKTVKNEDSHSKFLFNTNILDIQKPLGILPDEEYFLSCDNIQKYKNVSFSSTTAKKNIENLYGLAHREFKDLMKNIEFDTDDDQA